MYCVYDDDKNIIAFHDKKNVVESYVENIYKLHKIQLQIGKIKKESEFKLRGKDDLYLVRFGSTYVQSGYLEYLSLANDQIIEDDQFARDILYRILEMRDLNKKDSKIIFQAIKIMEKITEADESYTPTIKELSQLKYQYDPYIYNYKMKE